MKVLRFIFPLACYFVVESLFGYTWGAVAGIVLSLMSAGIDVAKGEKLSLRPVAADAVIILLFFIGDIVAERVSPSASPAITSVLIAALTFALSTPKGSLFTGTMMDSVRPMTSANPFAMKLVRGSLFRIGLWALLAAIVFLVSGLNDDTAAAKWVDSYLLITVLLATLATEIVVSRLIRKRYRNTEWVPLMTEDGLTVGGAPRPLVHNGSHWLHAVVHLHVINSKGELLLQLRPMSKKIQPGKWDTAVGGHITFGEKLEDALRRETLEEIGLTNFEAQFKGHYVWKCEAENEFVFVFVTKSDGPFEPKNADEVDELRFWSASELKAAIGAGILTPNIEKELRDWLLGTL